MNDVTRQTQGPVSEGNRIEEMDILRGIALLGVLMMNFVAFAGGGVMATDVQLASLSTARIDSWAYEAVRVLVGDKANTTFATLFGLGFYLQMKRGEGRPGFEARYCRRLGWLLLFGWLNVLFLWIWDILNLYALAGFGLLLMRKWSTRSLLIFGIPAALYSDKLQEALVKFFSIPIPGTDALYDDRAVLARQAIAVSGDYPAIVGMMWRWTYAEWLVGGLMVAWIAYALGRFALGAAIGRSGILFNIDHYVPTFRKVARVAIPVGISFGILIRLVSRGTIVLPGNAENWKSLAQILRSPTALILAAGYCAGVVVALRCRWGRKLFGPFGAAGRMALTNYLVQGLLYGFVLFGVGPGLALAGKIGTLSVVVICLGFFALQIMFSHWWLARFRFGPMEWLWRTLTYGERPVMRRSFAVPASA